MLITRIKFAAGALLLVATGSAALFGQASAPKAEPAGRGQAPATAAAGAAGKSDDQIDLEMLERAWADALARRDPTVVGRILADDFEGIDPAGATFSKPAYLTYIADPAHNWFVAENQLVETRVRLLGETGVVISLLRNNRSGRSLRSTKVYVRRRGRWQCAALHAGQGYGATFGEKARAEWVAALDEWKRFDADNIAAHKADCVSCHLPDVFQSAHFRRPGDPKSTIPAGHVSTIVAPFDGRVVKIQVGVGEVVKKGAPLLQFFSAEIAAAKSRYVAAVSQWSRDRGLADRKKGAVNKSDATSKQGVAKAEEIEARSRHQMEAARDQLLMDGMTDEDIDGLGKEPERDRPLLTIRAPEDGTVLAVAAALWSEYHREDVLVQLRSTPAQLDRNR
jgi:hypothetical protein